MRIEAKGLGVNIQLGPVRGPLRKNHEDITRRVQSGHNYDTGALAMYLDSRIRE